MAVPVKNNESRTTLGILGNQVDVMSWEQTIARINNWAQSRQSKLVCICNVHMAATANFNPELKQILDSADMVTPDGAPIAWVLKRSGHPTQERINGPDLMWRYLGSAEQEKQKVFFYGGKASTLALLEERIKVAYPDLLIAGMESPPFKVLSSEEDAAYIEMINSSGASVVFVGLGCPKQEKWMLEHRESINAVLVGVGAAFDYHAGTLKRAPRWMQDAGLEWLHRFSSEPGRLWKRYLLTNIYFLACMSMKGFKAERN